MQYVHQKKNRLFLHLKLSSYLFLSELLLLKKNLEDHFGFDLKCEIYNLTIEQFVKQNILKDKVDLTFTSIPYYDLEKYSIDIVSLNYENFNDWKEKFINCIFSLPNCLINLPEDLFDKCNEIHSKVLDTYCLVNQSARHMNKNLKIKKELIVKCF